MAKRNKTTRETYSRIIGYNFGRDETGQYDCIFDGGFWDPDTNKKQYAFGYYDASGNLVGTYITDYKGFREIIDQYDWPRR